MRASTTASLSACSCLRACKESLQVPIRRRLKRIANRLAKKGLRLIRIEQNDRHLITMRVIMETKRTRLGRAFVYPRKFLAQSPGRVIADAILTDYLRGYGSCPA